MTRSPEDYLVNEVLRTSRAVDKGLLTHPEFVNKILDIFASTDRIYPHIMSDLWAAVAEQVRGDLETALRLATLPEFRYSAFKFGGGRQLTEEEMQRDADLRTRLVRGWAGEFVRWFDAAK